MNIKEGDLVKLKSIEEIDPDDPPGVDEDMEAYLGTTVTIREKFDNGNGNFFFIEEDEGDFKYSIDWIDIKMKTSIPKNLKRMM